MSHPKGGVFRQVPGGSRENQVDTEEQVVGVRLEGKWACDEMPWRGHEQGPT